jgi:hypothetical protein
MDGQSFWALHRMLHPYPDGKIQPPSSSKKKNCDGAKNGLIPSTIHLATALCHFAGGSPYDIAGIFAISVTEVHQSVWRFVNTVNHKGNTAMNFEYPEDWAAQQ